MKCLFVLSALALFNVAGAQDIVGHWETYDDVTSEKKSIVEIYETEGVYYGRIVEIFLGDLAAICEHCRGAEKGKKLLGLGIIRDMRRKGDQFISGTILDPESGDTYKCNLQLLDNGRLKVRGYLGISLFGRTQYWIRSDYGKEEK